MLPIRKFLPQRVATLNDSTFEDALETAQRELDAVTSDGDLKLSELRQRVFPAVRRNVAGELQRDVMMAIAKAGTHPSTEEGPVHVEADARELLAAMSQCFSFVSKGSEVELWKEICRVDPIKHRPLYSQERANLAAYALQLSDEALERLQNFVAQNASGAAFELVLDIVPSRLPLRRESFEAVVMHGRADSPHFGGGVAVSWRDVSAATLRVIAAFERLSQDDQISVRERCTAAAPPPLWFEHVIAVGVPNNVRDVTRAAYRFNQGILTR